MIYLLRCKQAIIDFEILAYIASLSHEDIQKIIVHSVVETMDTDKE